MKIWFLRWLLYNTIGAKSIFKATLTNPADVTSTNWCGYTIYSAYPLEIFSCTAENNPDLNFLMAGYIVDGDLPEMSNMDILTTIADHSVNVEELINNLNRYSGRFAAFLHDGSNVYCASDSC
ncbi:hypothetical protein ACQCVK_12295 [Rossellomorea vietnamensis]|uniref:Uncharacterized protein n=1 Tax=Rossellomorea aquimaris TaxID=189382 RepID=A0A5D4TDZ7_9BACI|nr:hypothetical protein [Rossellomorea aquimaris]TYS73963.1 hypothetical protein FZC80_19100 [Rossellomorea aquimaris]